MNATTPLWALAATLAASLACSPAAASVDDAASRLCSPVQQDENGMPYIAWECLPNAESTGDVAAVSDGGATGLDDPLAGP